MKGKPELASEKPDFRGALAFAKNKSDSSVPTGDVRLTVNIDRNLHKRFKVHASRTGTTMGQQVEKWISENVPAS